MNLDSTSQCTHGVHTGYHTAPLRSRTMFVPVWTGNCISVSVYFVFIKSNHIFWSILSCRFPLGQILEQEDKGEATLVKCVVLIIIYYK